MALRFSRFPRMLFSKKSEVKIAVKDDPVLKILRQLLPAFIGISAGYPSAMLLIRFDRPLRFAGAFLMLLGLAYLLIRINYLNQRLDVEASACAKGYLRKQDSLGGDLPSWPLKGYFAIAGAALILACAFAWNVLPLLVVGGALWWWGDDLFQNAQDSFLRERLLALQPEARAGNPKHPETAARLKLIQEKKKEDPLLGVKIGAAEVLERVTAALKDERGVHVESLLCALGALAGYSCQASLRAQAQIMGRPEGDAFMVATDKTGRKYFFGEPLNHRLVVSELSVWNIARAAVSAEDGASLPDIALIFSHVDSTLGSDAFGMPRYLEGHAADSLPIEFLKTLWPVVFPGVKRFCRHPEEWPLLFAVALKDVVVSSKNMLAPGMALAIAMESAIPMSKVDLASA